MFLGKRENFIILVHLILHYKYSSPPPLIPQLKAQYYIDYRNYPYIFIGVQISIKNPLLSLTYPTFCPQGFSTMFYTSMAPAAIALLKSSSIFSVVKANSIPNGLPD